MEEKHSTEDTLSTPHQKQYIYKNCEDPNYCPKYFCAALQDK